MIFSNFSHGNQKWELGSLHLLMLPGEEEFYLSLFFKFGNFYSLFSLKMVII